MPAALLLMAAALTGCDTQPRDDGQAEPESVVETEVDSALTYQIDRSHADETAPAALFTAPDGKPARLADFRGKPLVVNLWATWCAPCIKEMPTLDALAVREGEAATVLVVSQDLTGEKAVAPFFAQRKFKRLEPYLDTENALATALAAQTLPVTVIYDARGIEVARVVGAMSWDGDRAAGLLDEADKATQTAG
ncbi:TlpA family protein disulfide reductase [Flavisphingopyxis soli]|uniref:TlpA family protein disulfide reductase n=1 Tax=Flavisphingopyxis soli TaxID=2601267 RepID=UPI001F383281|nr:TlpA disulfide reductase family protein [Sphingorhabdus soli]